MKEQQQLGSQDHFSSPGILLGSTKIRSASGECSGKENSITIPQENSEFTTSNETSKIPLKTQTDDESTTDGQFEDAEFETHSIFALVEDDNEYRRNPREKLGVLLPPRPLTPSKSNVGHVKERQKRAPKHQLMMHEAPPTKRQHPGETSGWFVDYFTNGGSADASPEANQSYWEELFLALVRFKDVHGHCCIPPSPCSPKAGSSAEEAACSRLADWASLQRLVYREVQIGRRCASDEEKIRFRRLEALGFVFNYEEWHWNKQYEELVKLQQQTEQRKGVRSKDKAEFAHCLGLALWLQEQRRVYMEGLRGKIHPMRADRVAKLEAINIAWVVETPTKPVGTSAQSVVDFVSSLAGTSAGSVRCSTFELGETSAAKSDDSKAVTSLTTTAVDTIDVAPQQSDASADSSPLAAGGSEGHSKKQGGCLPTPNQPDAIDVTSSPSTPGSKTAAGRAGAVSPETALSSVSLEIASPPSSSIDKSSSTKSVMPRRVTVDPQSMNVTP